MTLCLLWYTISSFLCVAPAGHVRSDRVVGGGGTTTIILKPNTAKVYQSPPTHMTAYMTTAMKTTTKYHFNPQHYSHRGGLIHKYLTLCVLYYIFSQVQALDNLVT